MDRYGILPSGWRETKEKEWKESTHFESEP
jgi:hypothetical protein